jgi:hypothetical protein
VFFRGRFSTKFWFNRTSKIGAVEGVTAARNHYFLLYGTIETLQMVSPSTWLSEIVF